MDNKILCYQVPYSEHKKFVNIQNYDVFLNTLVADSYTVAPLHRRPPVTNKREARLPYYGALFSETDKCYCFPCSSITYCHLMLLTLYFKSSLSTISIKSVNAVPIWDFLRSHFEVVMRIMTIAKVFTVMTTLPGELS